MTGAVIDVLAGIGAFFLTLFALAVLGAIGSRSRRARRARTADQRRPPAANSIASRVDEYVRP